MASLFKIGAGILFCQLVFAEPILTLPAVKVGDEILVEQKNKSDLGSSRQFLFEHFKKLNDHLACRKYLQNRRDIDLHQAILSAPSWLRLALSHVFLNQKELSESERAWINTANPLSIEFNPYDIINFDHLDTEFYLNAHVVTPLERSALKSNPPRYSLRYLDYDYYRKQVSFEITLISEYGVKKTTDVLIHTDQEQSKALAHELISILRNYDLLGPRILDEIIKFRFDLQRLARKPQFDFVEPFIKSLEAILNHPHRDQLIATNSYDIFKTYFIIKENFLKKAYPYFYYNSELQRIDDLHGHFAFSVEPSLIGAWALDFNKVLETPLYSDLNSEDTKTFFRILRESKNR